VLGNQGCARDLFGRDRDETLWVRDETETETAGHYSMTWTLWKTGQSVGKWDLMSRNVKLPITGKGILATATVWMTSLSKYSGLWEGSGITFTSDLKAATHCREAYSKANCVLGLISRTIRPKYKNPVVLTNLYKLMASQTSPGTLHSLHGIAWITILNSKTRYCLKKFASLACSLTWRSYHIGLGLRRQTESVETVVRRNKNDMIEIFKMLKNYQPSHGHVSFTGLKTGGRSWKLVMKKNCRCDTRLQCTSFLKGS